MLDDYDVRDFNASHFVESVPLRGDTLLPLQLPPLPTLQLQSAHLDISHGGEEGGQGGVRPRGQQWERGGRQQR